MISRSFWAKFENFGFYWPYKVKASRATGSIFVIIVGLFTGSNLITSYYKPMEVCFDSMLHHLLSCLAFLQRVGRSKEGTLLEVQTKIRRYQSRTAGRKSTNNQSCLVVNRPINIFSNSDDRNLCREIPFHTSTCNK